MSTIKIGLDAGHGLKTAGKQTPDGIKEWVLNDAVRDKVVKILEAYDCEIIHTDNNEGNVDETLANRLARYKNAGVNAFVSIHHNAYTGKWNNATGVEVYVDRGGTKQDYKLANAIYNRLVKYTGLKGRGVKEYNFWVINQDTIPAVLTEGGFMDSRNDYEIIISDEGQEAYAKAVAEGLIEVLNLKKKETVKESTTQKTTPTFEVGQVATLQVNLKVRTGAGTKYPQKLRTQLTANGKENAVKGDLAVLKAGTKVTIKSVKYVGDDIWVKIPSGWLAAYYKGNMYIK